MSKSKARSSIPTPSSTSSAPRDPLPLLREMPYGQDAKYSRRGLVERINSDLANDLGKRSTGVWPCSALYQGVVPEPGEPKDIDRSVMELAEATSGKWRSG